MFHLRLTNTKKQPQRLAALALYHKQCSEELRTQLASEISRPGISQWQIDTTNQYFEMQQHSLLDSLDIYLTNLDDAPVTKRKRPCECIISNKRRVTDSCNIDYLCSTTSSTNVECTSYTPHSSSQLTEGSYNVIHQHPVRPQRKARRFGVSLPQQAVAIMERWLSLNHEHPYPLAETARSMAESGNITYEQVTIIPTKDASFEKQIYI